MERPIARPSTLLHLTRAIAPSRSSTIRARHPGWICCMCTHTILKPRNLQPLRIKGTSVTWPTARGIIRLDNRNRLFSDKVEVRMADAGGPLPSSDRNRESKASQHFSKLMDTVQSNIFVAGQRLNDLTGYSGIEALKADIDTQESTLKEVRLALQQARATYSSSIASRSTSQREVNQLLHRKDSWTSADLERFTSLYRSDHANEQAELTAREQLAKAEKAAEDIAAKLSASILARYHEEQIWSDKIRRMSTWGTWGLMGVNVLLFLIFQIAVEPWRRKRLVQGFEEKVLAAIEKEHLVTRSVEPETLAQQGAIGFSATQPELVQPLFESTELDATTDTILLDTSNADKAGQQAFESTGPEVTEIAAKPMTAPRREIQRWLQELFSNQVLTIRRKDVTYAVLESAIAGVTFATLVLFLGRSRFS